MRKSGKGSTSISSSSILNASQGLLGWGTVLTFAAPDAYMDFPLNVQTAGTYTLTLSASSAGAATFSATAGSAKASFSSNTGGYQNCVGVSQYLYLAAGSQTLRLAPVSGSFGVQSMSLKSSAVTPSPTPTTTTPAVAATVIIGTDGAKYSYTGSAWNKVD